MCDKITYLKTKSTFNDSLLLSANKIQCGIKASQEFSNTCLKSENIYYVISNFVYFSGGRNITVLGAGFDIIQKFSVELKFKPFTDISSRRRRRRQIERHQKVLIILSFKILSSFGISKVIALRLIYHSIVFYSTL